MIAEADWKIFLELLRKLKCKVRLGIRGAANTTEWGTSLIEPASNYVELPSYGPVKKSDVAFIDFDPIIVTRIGRIVPDKKQSVEAELAVEFEKWLINFEKGDTYFRVK